MNETTKASVQYIKIATMKGARKIPVFLRRGGLAIHPAYALIYPDDGGAVPNAWVVLTAESEGLKVARFYSVAAAERALKAIVDVLDWRKMTLKKWPPPAPVYERLKRSLVRAGGVR